MIDLDLPPSTPQLAYRVRSARQAFLELLRCLHAELPSDRQQLLDQALGSHRLGLDLLIDQAGAEELSLVAVTHAGERLVLAQVSMHHRLKPAH